MRCHPKAIAYVAHAHTLCDARTKQPGNAPAQAADRGRYLQIVIPAKSLPRTAIRGRNPEAGAVLRQAQSLPRTRSGDERIVSLPTPVRAQAVKTMTTTTPNPSSDPVGEAAMLRERLSLTSKSRNRGD